MKSLLYGSLALVAAHISSAAIVISGAPGGNLTISIDAPIVLDSTTVTGISQMALVFSNAYGSDQTSASVNLTTPTFSLSAPSINTGGNPISAQVPPGSGPDYDLNDFGIVFAVDLAGRNPGETFTIGTGSAVTAAAIPLPGNSGTFGLYFVDESGTRMTEIVDTSVTFTAIPEPAQASVLLGLLAFAGFFLRRRR